MGLTALQGSGVRQENSRVLVTQNRCKKVLAEVFTSTFSNTTAVDAWGATRE